MKKHLLTIAALLAMISLLGPAPAAAAPARADDPESVELNIQNLLECSDLSPYVSFNYPDYLRTRGSVIAVDRQFLGYMTSLEPGKDLKGMPYFSATIMLLKAYDKPQLVLDKYLQELDGYLLQHDFNHHTISSIVLTDGAGKPTALPGRGYIVTGIVSADGPLQGLAFSEEFHTFTLPGNVDLRMVFKYPAPAQNNELLRSTIESIMASTVVHLKFFNLAGDTSLGRLKRN